MIQSFFIHLCTNNYSTSFLFVSHDNDEWMHAGKQWAIIVHTPSSILAELENSNFLLDFGGAFFVLLMLLLLHTSLCIVFIDFGTAFFQSGSVLLFYQHGLYSQTRTQKLACEINNVGVLNTCKNTYRYYGYVETVFGSREENWWMRDCHRQCQTTISNCFLSDNEHYLFHFASCFMQKNFWFEYRYCIIVTLVSICWEVLFASDPLSNVNESGSTISITAFTNTSKHLHWSIVGSLYSKVSSHSSSNRCSESFFALSTPTMCH